MSARTLQAHDGSTVTVGQASSGRRQVAWFFPKANTPNCTVQARLMAEQWGTLAARGVDVVGVSFDPIPALAAWARQLAVPYPLCSATLADAEALGAARPAEDPWREALPLRVALITDPAGAVLARWLVRDANAFAEQVRAALNLT